MSRVSPDMPTAPDAARTPQPPTLWAAAALIALYFLLQAVGSGLIALVMGAVSGLVRLGAGLGMTLPTNPAFFALAVLLGLAAPLLGGVLTYLLAHGNPVTQDIQTLGTHTPMALRVLLVIAVVALGPLVEELLFRGVLLSSLLHRWPVGWSMAISALLFSVVHLPSMQWSWYALPDLALLALGLAWLRLRAGSLWPAVVAHGVNNLLAVMVWFVATSPG
ncbi:MAG: hypothetical protein WDW38_004977 [Sanguina aurantia]